MYIPLSWLKEYVDIQLSLHDLAKLLTMVGLEVESVRLVGLAGPDDAERHEFKFTGLAWHRQTIVVAQIDEVMPHPNADRLVLCRLQDGQQEHIVLTGAPNLYPYKGRGLLEKPLKVAYAKEGARIYDGHQPGQVLSTLKRTSIRGVDSYSMVASEKELGISDEHEGVIILDDDAITGTPLVDYMGDAVFEISILPNMIHNASVSGVARELAAVTGQPLRRPQMMLPLNGRNIEGQVSIEITHPDLNPRFVVGLVRGVTPQESPYWVQRRLRLAGMRPINSIVDATNYVMLETGQPLHAFDYDRLVQRAGGKAPVITTRTAHRGEMLTTLDNTARHLEEYTILVTDTAGPLSLAGIMGGLESEVTANTRNVLLEGASWDIVSVRKTAKALRIQSEAAYRFSRGVHPALAEQGVLLGLDRIAQWSGGTIAAGLVDNYAKPARHPIVRITTDAVRRWLGIELTTEEVAGYLQRLEFETQIEDSAVLAKTPPHRLDINEGIIGQADLLEEVARIHGYNNFPETRLADVLPKQRGNPLLEMEERLRDVLVALDLLEVSSYRMVTPGRERRALSPDAHPEDAPYVQLANPIAADRTVMRRGLLPTMLEILERNIRLRDRLGFFEIGPVFLPEPGEDLPIEQQRLCIVITGLRSHTSWDRPEAHTFDFYDLKGIIEAALAGMHISAMRFAPGEHPSFHPGKCAQVIVADKPVGIMGELHPLVKKNYDYGQAPVLAAELEVNTILRAAPVLFIAEPVPVFPPVLEDIAVIVGEDVPAERVVATIRKAGGKMLIGVRLFDIYRGPQIEGGKKSMAYSMTYQAPDRTLTDAEAQKMRLRVIRALERDLGAKVRTG
ncbi:MAG TPA: phenylalanine--tRNA ligase subunit beta [Levilinea sp.]|nr:phenylalanine--tRNA ligase subunit beta [Levilinea sp.]